jgi:hypothetical protein
MEPWMECEFLHIKLIQCEKASESHNGCMVEANRLFRCLKARM